MRFAKYFLTFKNVLQNELEFRTNTVINFLFASIVLISTIYLWSNVFTNRVQIAGYTKEQIITYYILVAFLLVAINSDLTVIDDIRTGGLSAYITRPISYIWYQYWQSLGRKLFRIVTGLPILFLIFFIFRNQIYLVTNPYAYLLLMVTIFSAINLLFLIDLLVQFLEFWFTNSFGFNYIIEIAIRIFAGTLIPLAFLPGWIVSIGNFLPFQYTGAFIIDAFLGRLSYNQIFLGIGIQILWTFFLAVMAQLIWLKGLKKYEAYGS